MLCDEFLCHGLVGSKSAHLIQKKFEFIFVCFGLIQYPTFNVKMRILFVQRWQYYIDG